MRKKLYAGIIATLAAVMIAVNVFAFQSRTEAVSALTKPHVEALADEEITIYIGYVLVKYKEKITDAHGNTIEREVTACMGVMYISICKS